MTKPIIIFGNKDLAEMAKWYWGSTVVGFTMDNPESDTFLGFPMYDFATITETRPPSEYDMFIPVIDNRTRAKIYNKAKALGYRLPSYIHHDALVWNRNAIGDNCFIQEYNNIQYKTTVGNNVIMWAGNHIGHHSIIDDHCFFTSHVCMSGHCHIGSHSYLGVNATIRDFGEIAEGTFVSMDTSITKNITEPWGMYRGSPARRLKNVE